MDRGLSNGSTYAGGQQTWNVEIQGGDLGVKNSQFTRLVPATGLVGTASLSNNTFPTFTSDTWLLRAFVHATSTEASQPTNYLILSLTGDAGTYGFRIFVNRTDGNFDVNIGQNGTFSDLYAADVYQQGTLPNRDFRVTLLNRHSQLYLLIDDYQLRTRPATRLIGPLAGAVPSTLWKEARITFGPAFTGTVSSIELYNVDPFLETFTSPPIDPLVPINSFEHIWSVFDSNNPIGWALQSDSTTSGTLRWKGTGSVEPVIEGIWPQADFVSNAWVCEATVTFQLPTNNLGEHRVALEFRADTGESLGVVIPRTTRNNARMIVYNGSETNVVATGQTGTDFLANIPYRLSMVFDRGELRIRINDRVLFVTGSQHGLDVRHWNRIRIGGSAVFPFTADNVLLFNGAPGSNAVEANWAHYE